MTGWKERLCEVLEDHATLIREKDLAIAAEHQPYLSGE